MQREAVGAVPDGRLRAEADKLQVGRRGEIQVVHLSEGAGEIEENADLVVGRALLVGQRVASPHQQLKRSRVLLASEIENGCFVKK